jgi:hypothetical protein
MKNIYLGPNIILFGDHKCVACLTQIKMLSEYFKKLNKPLDVKYYDLRKKEAPHFLGKNVSKPTWYFPKTKNNGIIIENLVLPEHFIDLMDKKKNAFGSNYWGKDQFDTNFAQLRDYGKTFKDSDNGFQIKKSWDNKLTEKWGNPIDSGTLGREFGPGNTDKIYSTKYFNNIRMARPGDDLSETLYSNRNCNLVNNPKAATEMVGLFYDSPQSPQVVTNQFGKKKKSSSFGSNLYSQMGPSYEKGNQYLVGKNTFANLYGGATQFAPQRPNKVMNKNLYIGQSPTYNPLTTNYKLNTKIGEGTEIVLNKNGKLKFRPS